MILLGNLYEDQGDYAAAAQVCRNMLKIKSDDYIAMNNLASYLVKLQKPTSLTEAMDAITQALRLEPKESTFYDTQAAVYADLAHDFPGALRAIDQAIAFAPADPNWKVSRISILAKSGQRQAATSEYNQLKKDQALSRLLNSDSQQKLKQAGLE